ncbi:MAG: fibronectin type III domain-containing protein [Vicinamibacterales bacterium]
MLKVTVRLLRFWSTCLLCLLCVTNAEAATVRLAWDPAPEADVAGYRILYGTQSGHYLGAIDVAKSTDFTITSLPDDLYYFAVQAYTLEGSSSVPSNEVIAAVGTVPRFVAGCVTADPFASMGGGTCYKGGWLPPGMSPPSGGSTSVVSAPPSTPGVCTTADPFASMGGGTCYNGGWLPPGMVIPGGSTTPPSASTPPPSSTPPASSRPTTCSTADPFASLGGGTCYNGGWLPPGMPIPGGSTTTTPPASTPPPSSSTPPAPTGPTTCSTSDPFAAMGGGTCYRGGWLSPGMAIPSGGTVSPSAPPSGTPPPPTNLILGCATPDPFTAMGGGTCVNGGWLAPGMKGATGDAAHVTVTGTLQVLNGTDGLWLILGDDRIVYTSHSIIPAHLLIDDARVTFVGVVVTPATPGTAAVVDILTIEFLAR